jgi:hypothetical protein
MIIEFSNLIKRGLLFGWEYYPALDKDDHKEIKVYLIVVCLHFKWVYGKEV